MTTKKREIYAVRFNKCQAQNDVYFTIYTVGVLFLGGLNRVTPLKIELIKEDTRVLITFDNQTYQEIGLEPSVELFWRDVEPRSKTKKKDG